MALTQLKTRGIANDAVNADKLANAINTERTANTAKNLSALNASNLTSGTVPDARFPATLPAASAANLTAVPAANVTGTLPAISAANLTNIPAANITGTLPAIDGSNLTGISSIGGATGADFNDNVKLRFGTTDHDLEIYHDGSNSYVRESGTGNLRFPTTKAEFRNNGDTQTLASFTDGGACEFHYNDVKKLQTTSSGADIINTTSPLGNTSASSAANDLVISGDGDTGLTIYTTNSSSKSSIFFGDPDDVDVGSIRYLHNHNQIRLQLNANSTPVMQFNSDLTIIFQNTIYSNGAAYSTGSDLRMKSNLVQFTNTLDDLKKITGYKFDITNKATGHTRKSAGVIAQDVEKVYPDFVVENPETGMKSLEYNTFIGVLVEAVKELTTKVETLEAKVAALEAK